MKTKKTLAFALVLSMVFSLFCALPSVSAEETEDGSTSAAAAVTPAYETFNGGYYTGGDVYSLANNSNLEGMKYFYYYVNYVKSSKQGPTIAVHQTVDNIDSRFFPKNENPSEIKAVKLDGTPVAWTLGGANKLNFPNEWNSFEGYVILSISDNLYNATTGSTALFDTTAITHIEIVDMNDATSVGDFGFARSYADAVNAVSGKLNKYYDTEKVAPLSTYNKNFDTINEQEVPLYQNTDGRYADKKWVGFRVSAKNQFRFNFALVENNNAWWWINDNTEKKYYYLTADGTCTEYSNYANHGFCTYDLSVSNGFKTDGWIIFNTDELISDTHPSYKGNDDSSLSLNELKSIKLFSVSGGDAFNAKPEYSIGDVALATDKDSLVNYYTAKNEVTAVTLNPISKNVKQNDTVSNLSDVDLTTWKSGCIGFYLNKNSLSYFSMLFHEKEAAGSGGYWANSVGKTLFVTKDGKYMYVTNGGNFALTVPEDFTEGYVLIEPSVFTIHSAYQDKVNDTFDIGGIDKMQIVTADSEIKIQYLSVATDGNALLAHLKAEVEGDHTDNVDIINTEISARTKSTDVDVNNTEISVKAYDYFEDSTAEMKYVGFRFKTDGNYGNIKIGFVEENGAMYWRGEKATYYFVKSDGTLQEGNTRSDSAENYKQAIYSESAFDGYVIIPLSSLVNHPGHKDDNGKFDIASLAEVRHFGLENASIEIGDFAFGTDMASLLDYLVNADKTQLSIYGDANGDGTLDILDLIRMKKYLADDTTEIRVNAFDINRDGEKSLLDLVTLRKYLILGK